MKIKDLVFSVSLLSNVIYLGKTNKKGSEFLEKEDVTAQVISSTIQHIGENKSKIVTFENGAKFKITVEKLNELNRETELFEG